MDGMIANGTFNIVRRTKVTREQLEKIAEILNIPPAERDQLVSGIVYLESESRPAPRRAARSSTASGTASRTPRRRK
jgi:hypothetical protein